MLTALIDTPASDLQKSSKTPAHATSLAPADRMDLVVAVLSRTEPVTRMAAGHGVSRKFLYRSKLSPQTTRF